MGLPSVEQKDLDVMEKLLNEIDFSTKYTIFFQDVMHHEKEMIEKNEQYVDELENRSMMVRIIWYFLIIKNTLIKLHLFYKIIVTCCVWFLICTLRH